MIQRIQSLYLLLVAIISFLCAFTAESIVDFVQNQREELIIYITIGLMALVSIFSYKNRNFQVLINNINIIINVLLIGSGVYFLLNLPGGEQPEKGIWLIAPLVNIVLLIFANINIKRDIELVKSVDRLR